MNRTRSSKDRISVVLGKSQFFVCQYADIWKSFIKVTTSEGGMYMTRGEARALHRKLGSFLKRKPK